MTLSWTAFAAEPHPPTSEMLGDFVKIASKSITQQDTKSPVFHGCWDWHSAVHGHWAILRATRFARQFGVDTFKKEAQAVGSSLDPRKIILEMQQLTKDPSFEMPYGRAWLLRLTMEFEIWAHETYQEDIWRLLPLGNEVALSMVKYFEANGATPEKLEYENASWALIQLYDYYFYRGDAVLLARVEKLIRDGFLLNNYPISFSDDASTTFFSLFGNWLYLAAKSFVDSDWIGFVSTHTVDFSTLKPIVPSNSHGMGMNWSRAWALKAAGDRSADSVLRKSFEKAFEEHVQAGWLTHLKAAGDYQAYDHWVPQFAIYALTEGEIQ